MNAHALRIGILMGLAVLAVGPAVAQERTGASGAEVAHEDSAFTHVSPQIERLARYIGLWSVTVQYFDRAGQPSATLKGTEEITWLLDRQAIQRAFTTQSESTTFRALGILTFNQAVGRYQGVWFDNDYERTHDPTQVEGEWNDKGDTVVYTLTSMNPDGTKSEYRVVERFPDPQQRIATTYQVEDDTIKKLSETQFTRAKPCPDRIYRVFDQ